MAIGWRQERESPAADACGPTVEIGHQERDRASGYDGSP
jgi:hypothetical protein